MCIVRMRLNNEILGLLDLLKHWSCGENVGKSRTKEDTEIIDVSV